MSTYFLLFEIESNTITQKYEQQDSIDEEIEAEIKSFFATENLYAETEKDKVLKWLDLNKQNIHFLPALQENILLNYHLLCISKDYFLKLVICTRKSVIVCFKRPAKNKQLLILFFLIL